MHTSLPKLTTAALLAGILASAGCTAQIRKSRYAERADRYFKAGQYDEAKIEYLKLIRVDSRSADAYARMGQMWLEEGAALRAGPFLLAALKYNPDDAESRVRLARVYSLVGEPAEARKEALTILKQKPDNGEALLLFAEMSRTPAERAEAEQQIQQFPQQQTAYAHLARGAVALQKGDLAGGEAEFQQALAADPKLPQAHVAVALLLLTKKETDQASQELKTAAELAPIRSRERLNYAEYKTKTGATEEAKNYLNSLTTQARDFIGAWILRAKIAVAQKQYEDAVSLLENVFSRDPDNLDGRVLRAQIYLAQNQPNKAVEILQNLDKSFPNSAAIKYQLAVAYLQARNIAQATTEAEEAVALNHDFADAVLLLAELNIRAGKAQATIDPLSSLLKSRPDLTRAQVLLVDAFQATGRFDEATSILREQIKASPQNPQLYLLLGVLMRNQRKTEEARQAFEKVMELDKNDVLAADQLVSLDVAANSFDQAHQRVNKMLQRNPQSAAAHLLEGKINLAQKQFDQAEVSLKKAIELDPNQPVPYKLLVNLYIATNKLSDAVGQLNTILAKNPRDIPALTVLGLVREQQNDTPEAREAYEKALGVDPNALVPLNNLAYIYSAKLNDLARASELARKAHDLAPLQPNITDTLGWIVYQQRDYQQAVQLLQDAANKLPENPEVQFHLGMAQYMMGNRDAARAALQKAVAASGEFPWKPEANSRLASLSDSTGAATKVSAADLEEIVKEKGTDPVALVQLGDSYVAQGRPDQAVNAYERALQANPQFAEATLKLAQINAGPLKNNAKALEYAKKARALAPKDPHVTATVGRIAYQAGNVSWAYSLLQDSARQLPDDPNAAHDFAWAAYSQGRITEAEQTMRRVLSMPNAADQHGDADRFIKMVEIDSQDKDPTPLEGQVNAALASDPKYVPALMLRADIELRRNDAKSATAIYTEVLRSFPDFAPAQKRLAEIYLDDPAASEKAYQFATKARRSLPDDPVLAATLARASFQRKEYARVVQLLGEAGQKRPLDGRALFCLGMAQLQLGHKEEARQALERALTAGLPDALAGQAKSEIAGLGKGPSGR